MKRSLCLAFLLLTAGLFTPARASSLDHPARASEEAFPSSSLIREASGSAAPDRSLPVPVDSSAVPESDEIETNPSTDETYLLAGPGCTSLNSVSAQHPAEIPDDGSWLELCWSDPHAPPTGKVEDVSVKYDLDHPDSAELDIRLTRSGIGLVQPLLSRGVPASGSQRGKAKGLTAFKGQPARGEWRLQVRDTVPGKKGSLRSATVKVNYPPTGPLPVQKGGSPGHPGSLYAPPGDGSSKTQDKNPNKPHAATPTPAPKKPTAPAPTPKKGASSPAAQSRAYSATATSWQWIKNETYEGAFPNCGGAFASTCWTVTGQITDTLGISREYLWDDSSVKAHNGYYAAWPAAGGQDARDPAGSYAPRMNSWMKYGPFDLRAGTNVNASFWMWWNIEAGYDRVWFALSTDNINWSGWWWDGNSDTNQDGIPDWQQPSFDLSSYAGSANVWVTWIFESDSTLEFEGPWVDDIQLILLPGETTISGKVSYFDRNGQKQDAAHVNVYLYDRDPDGSEWFVQAKVAGGDGRFAFDPLMNWDVDTADPDRRMDLFVIWETSTTYDPSPRRTVTDINSLAYRWRGPNADNIRNGPTSFDVNVEVTNPTLPAMWILQDLNRGRDYVLGHTNPAADPGLSDAWWELQRESNGFCGNSCFTATGAPTIFIAQRGVNSSDTILHELGHNYMWNATRGWWNGSWNCWDHTFFKLIDQGCAWSEGWADFYPLAVNNDPCFDFNNAACGAGSVNLETHSWREPGDTADCQTNACGDKVEARVAGALWDFYDNVNDGRDTVSWGFGPIWSQMARSPGHDNFRSYWDGWRASGQETHLSVQAIYQNTMDFDNAPVWNPVPIPVLRNMRLTIDLRPYLSDTETPVDLLTFTSATSSTPNCAVGLSGPNGRLLTITPASGYLGTCNITVTAYDGIKVNLGTFPVTVTPWGVFLPLMMKD